MDCNLIESISYKSIRRHPDISSDGLVQTCCSRFHISCSLVSCCNFWSEH